LQEAAEFKRNNPVSLADYFKRSLLRADPFPMYTSVPDFEHERQVNRRNDLRQYDIVEWPPEVRPSPFGRRSS
jgi:hypothetical protein